MFTFLSKTRKLEISYSEKETDNPFKQKKKNLTKDTEIKIKNNIQYKHNGPNNLRK